MSRLVLLLSVALGGCKTAEVAVTHPMTGVQVVAKFESFEPAAYQTKSPAIANSPLPSPAWDLWSVEPIVVR